MAATMSKRLRIDDTNIFDQDSEKILAHQLHKYNPTSGTFGNEGQTLLERRRNDSLRPQNSCDFSDNGTRFHSRIPHSSLPGFDSGSRPLSIDPTTIKLDSSNMAEPSLSSSSSYPISNLWTSQSSSMPLVPATATAPAPGSISRYGQYTPPDDVSQKPVTMQRHGCINRSPFRPESYAMDEDEKRMLVTSPDSMSEIFKEDSTPPPQPPKKRRRKSCKTVNAEEEIKREEFLARNRVAASKSRQKKKEWTQALEEQLKNLQAENTHLAFTVNCLRDEIIGMKTMCLAHVDCDCTKIRDYMNRSLEMLGAQNGRQLSMLTSPKSSNHPTTIINGNSDQFMRQVSQPSSTRNLQATMPSPISGERTSIQALVNPPDLSGSKHSSDISASTASSSSTSSRVGQSLSPTLATESFDSPEPKVLPENLLERRDVDMDMSAMWNEAVSDGDYITGVTN